MLLAYREFETGSLSRRQFESKLQNEFEIAITPDFNRVMNDDRRSYLSLLKSLHISTRRLADPPTNYYETPHTGKVRTSTDLTTAVPRKGPESVQKQSRIDDLSKSTKEFLQGRLSSTGYLGALQAHHVPLTPEIQRGIREQETSQSANFRNLGQAVLTAIKYVLLSSSEGMLSERPHKRNPSPLRGLTRMLMPESSKLDRQKASAEMIQQELGTITVGLPLTHKKKVPVTRDHGNITAWEDASAKDAPIYYRKDQTHHDVLRWK